MPQRVLEILKAPDFSDGDSTHRPDTDDRYPTDPQLTLQSLAVKWMVDNQHDVERGKVYTFDKLPDGYAVYARARHTSITHVDKYIYGHPFHRVFRSTEQFLPHFSYLALYTEGKVCSCDFCQKRDKRGARKAPTAKARSDRRRAPASKGPKAGESSPAFPSLFTLLEEQGKFDLSMEDRQDLDWRGENEIVAEVLQLVSRQPSFVPRAGELVLWYDQIDGEIRQDPSSGDFLVFHPPSRRFTGHPQWMGGVVTQAPVSEQPIGFEDIERESGKEYAVTSSGFRIEMYPGPNARNKNLSNRYSHVPMHHIRPLAFWMEYMAGIPNEDWHPTIKNCLEAMGTLSTIKRHRLRGERPGAKLYAKGCFLGAEALFAGDIVRVSLDPERMVSECLEIHEVVTRVENVESSESELLFGEKKQRTYVEFNGSAFTLDSNRSATKIPLDPIDIHPVMRDYGPWFDVGFSLDTVTLDHSHILGRLFEKRAMELWSPRHRSTVMDMGSKGVLEARGYATNRDLRMKHAKDLYVADSRAEALNLRTFNGIDVGASDPELDPRLWQDVSAALVGIENQREQSSAEIDPMLTMMTGALNEDSGDEAEAEAESSDATPNDGNADLTPQTKLAAIADWNRKRGRRTESEGSSDELQGPSSQKRSKFFRVEL